MWLVDYVWLLTGCNWSRQDAAGGRSVVWSDWRPWKVHLHNSRRVRNGREVHKTARPSLHLGPRRLHEQTDTSESRRPAAQWHRRYCHRLILQRIEQRGSWELGSWSQHSSRTVIITRSIWKMLGPFATASRRTPPVLHCHSPGVTTVARRHCRMPPAHRCPQQRQPVTGGPLWAHLLLLTHYLYSALWS